MGNKVILIQVWGTINPAEMSFIAMHCLLQRAGDADDVDDGSVAFRLDCLDYTHTCVCIMYIYMFQSLHTTIKRRRSCKKHQAIALKSGSV